MRLGGSRRGSTPRADLDCGMASHPFTGAGLGVLMGCLLVGAAGCGEEQIEERQLPKGTEQVPAGEGAGAEAARADGGGAPWVAPDRWRQVPGERPMRLATFEAPDEAGGGAVEIAVTRFPGRVGGELANMNRWRGQMGLPPLEEGELEAAIERWEAPGWEGYQARIEGGEGDMLAAGVYEEAEDRTWFVRATAPAEVADRIEDEMWAFARSIAGLGPAEEGVQSGGG
jgi:hypothetical protein